MTGWLGPRLAAADTVARAAQGRVVLRRLNRVEYENTIRDLVGTNVSLREQLPEGSSADGFDNASEAHHALSFLIEKPPGRLFQRPCRQTKGVRVRAVHGAKNDDRDPPLRLCERKRRAQGWGREVGRPGWAIQYIDVEGPLNVTWPPETHRRVFDDLPRMTITDTNFGDRMEVVRISHSSMRGGSSRPFRGGRFAGP